MNSFTDNFKDSDQKLKISIQKILPPPLPDSYNNFFSTIARISKFVAFNINVLYTFQPSSTYQPKTRDLFPRPPTTAKKDPK